MYLNNVWHKTFEVTISFFLQSNKIVEDTFFPTSVQVIFNISELYRSQVLHKGIT